MPCTYVHGSGPEMPESEPSVRVTVRERRLAAGEPPGGVEVGSEKRGPREVRLSRASWSFQAMALRRRIRLASLTRRRKSGSVVRVRNVSLRILE